MRFSPDGKSAYFWSPRNSQREAECTLEEADALAEAIFAQLGTSVRVAE